MKICMVATRHPIDDARITHKEAISLVRKGHEVHFLSTCDKELAYRAGRDQDGNIIAQGLGEDASTSYLGLSIHGVTKGNGLLGKYLNFRRMVQLACEIKADIYHCHEGDLSLAVAVSAKKRLMKSGHKCCVVYDVHEYWPGAFAQRLPDFMQKFAIRLYSRWEARCLKYTDQVFTANSIERGHILLMDRFQKVDILYNAPSRQVFGPQPQPINWHNRRIFICHEGTLSFSRGLKQMTDVLEKLRDRNICLYIVGDIIDKEELKWFEKEIQKRDLQNHVKKTGWLQYNQIADALKMGDIGLIMFRPIINNMMAGPPNKLFNYMYFGMPIISVDFPEIRYIIGGNECGLLVDGEDTESIVSAITHLLDNPDQAMEMGEQARQLYENKYSWDVMERRLIRAYQRLGNILSSI